MPRMTNDSWLCRELGLDDEKIDPAAAQLVADAICSHLGWDKIKVVYSDRPTRRQGGTYFRDRNLIRLNNYRGEGTTWGTLIHELAHKAANDHSANFFYAQDCIIRFILPERVAAFELEWLQLRERAERKKAMTARVFAQPWSWEEKR